MAVSAASSIQFLADPPAVQNRLKYVYTIVIYASYFATGTHESVSVMFLDIAHLTQTSASLVSAGISAKFIGYGIGSMIVGYMLDHVFNRQLAFAFATTGTAIAFSMFSMMTHIYGYYAAQFMNGLFYTFVDVSAFTWIIEMWDDHSNPFMLGLFFFQSMGQTVGPIVVKPFLSYVTTEGSGHVGHYHESRIRIPSVMLAAGTLIPVTAILIMYCRNPYQQLHLHESGGKGCERRPSFYGATTTATKQTSHHSSKEDPQKRPPVVRVNSKEYPNWGTRIVSCLLVASIASAMIDITTFLPIFAVFCDLHLTKTTGAVAGAVNSASAAVMLFLSIWVAKKISPRIILFIGMGMNMIGCILTAISVYSEQVMFLWIGVVIGGAGIAVLLPTAYSFLSQEMTVTNTQFGMITFSKSIVRIVIPLVVGSVMETQANYYIYLQFVSMCVSILMLIMLKHITR